MSQIDGALISAIIYGAVAVSLFACFVVLICYGLICKAIAPHKKLLDAPSQGGEYYNSFADALKMLETQCEPLKFEVFMTYTNMIANGALEKFNPNDVMLHAMMEWDL